MRSYIKIYGPRARMQIHNNYSKIRIYACLGVSLI